MITFFTIDNTSISFNNLILLWPFLRLGDMLILLEKENEQDYNHIFQDTYSISC